MPSRLKITGYKDDTFSSKAGEYEILYNPNSLVHSMRVTYAESQAMGTTASGRRYQSTEPETLDVEFVFDCTIESADDSVKKPVKVDKALKSFKDLVYTYNGSIHRPNYVMLSWGEFIFKGQITSLTVTYAAINIEGEALRANVKAAFEEVTDLKTRLSEEDRQSSDLTHIYFIKEGDTLPVLAEKIYGSTNYYIDIARINGLNNFRRLTPGERIIFPPLEKK